MTVSPDTVCCWLIVLDLERVSLRDSVMVNASVDVRVSASVSVAEDGYVTVNEEVSVIETKFVGLIVGVSVDDFERLTEKVSVKVSVFVFWGKLRDFVSLAVISDDAVAVDVWRWEGLFGEMLIVSESVSVCSLVGLLV